MFLCDAYDVTLFIFNEVPNVFHGSYCDYNLWGRIFN